MAKRAYGNGGSVNSVESSSNYVPKSVQPKKTSKKTYIICGVIIGILLIVAIVFGILAYRSNKENKEIIQMWDTIREVVDNDDFVPDMGDDSEAHGYTQTEGYSTDPMDREIDFASLKAINSDVLCWLYIPGTSIDYPVMQEPRFGETYYLHRNIYKVEQSAGCILTPAEIDTFEGEDAHMLIFGHRMQNTSMFGTLVKYKEEDFYKEYPYVYLYYPDHTERWAIFATEHLKDTHRVYDMPYFYDTVEYEDLIKSLFDSAMYKTRINNVKLSQRTLTLSTCDNLEGTGVGRFTVNAVIDKSVSLAGADLLDNVNHSIIPQANGNSNVILEEDSGNITGDLETLYEDASENLDVRN